jgi:DNA end-binding protein Ku
MPKTTKKFTTPTHGHRSSWKGQLTFGLVSFTVEAFNALNRDEGDIHFHQIHAKCHKRIKYQKVCPIHGEVSNDEIVSGYEFKKGQYVELDPDDLKALRKESDRALKIEAFVSPETIDPLYFDGRMYYLSPVGAASQEPYAVILGAMEKQKRCGVGSVIFSGKDQLALVRPLDGILHMAMLNYDAEIRKASSVVHVSKASKSLSREIGMAETFIEEWTEDDFDFSKYEDSHREDVKKLIESKLKGKKIVIAEEKEAAPVLNLMEALKKSVHSRSALGKTKKRSHSRAA